MVKIIDYTIKIIKYRIFMKKKILFEGEDYQINNLY